VPTSDIDIEIQTGRSINTEQALFANKEREQVGQEYKLVNSCSTMTWELAAPQSLSMKSLEHSYIIQLST
jgi:hypothetical protein